MAPPLLHVGESVRAATMHADPRVVAAGIVLFAAVAVRIWARPLARVLIRTPGRARCAVWPVAAVIAGTAVLPSLFPYDHVVAAPAHADAHASVHASHCHDTPGSCADAPVTSGPGGMLSAEPLLAEPAMVSLAIIATVAFLAGITLRPDLRPPMPCRRIA